MYEYKVLHAWTLKGLEKELNKLAAEGWRLVTSCDPPTHIFERAKS